MNLDEETVNVLRYNAGWEEQCNGLYSNRLGDAYARVDAGKQQTVATQVSACAICKGSLLELKRGAKFCSRRCRDRDFYLQGRARAGS